MATSNFNTTQYDNIGEAYNTTKELPSRTLPRSVCKAILGDLTGLKVLELACGTGNYSLDLLRWGAEKVTAIDISPGMIGVAEKQSRGIGEGRLEFHVGDCTEPNMLSKLGLAAEVGSYDVVFAAWLLNYASDAASLRAMFDNIISALKPGARFVGLTVNAPLVDEFGPGKPYGRDDRYGSTWEMVGAVEDGYKICVTNHTDPPVRFECFFLGPEVHATAAEGAGLRGMKWTPVNSDEQAIRERGREFWTVFDRQPHCAVYTANRPEGHSSDTN